MEKRGDGTRPLPIQPSSNERLIDILQSTIEKWKISWKINFHCFSLVDRNDFDAKLSNDLRQSNCDLKEKRLVEMKVNVLFIELCHIIVSWRFCRQSGCVKRHRIKSFLSLIFNFTLHRHCYLSSFSFRVSKWKVKTIIYSPITFGNFHLNNRNEKWIESHEKKNKHRSTLYLSFYPNLCQNDEFLSNCRSTFQFSSYIYTDVLLLEHFRERTPCSDAQRAQKWKRRFVGRNNVSTASHQSQTHFHFEQFAKENEWIALWTLSMCNGHLVTVPVNENVLLHKLTVTGQEQFSSSSNLENGAALTYNKPFFLKDQLRQRSFVIVREKSTMVWWVVHSTRTTIEQTRRLFSWRSLSHCHSVKRKWITFTHWLVEGLNDHQRPLQSNDLAQSMVKILQRQPLICQKTPSTIFELTANTTLCL